MKTLILTHLQHDKACLERARQLRSGRMEPDLLLEVLGTVFVMSLPVRFFSSTASERQAEEMIDSTCRGNTK